MLPLSSLNFCNKISIYTHTHIYIWVLFIELYLAVNRRKNTSLFYYSLMTLTSNPGPVILLKASHSGLVLLFPRDLDSRSVLGCRLGEILLSCPSIDDSQFDHVVQMVSARYFHSTEPLLFCNQEIGTFRTWGHPVSQQPFSRQFRHPW